MTASVLFLSCFGLVGCEEHKLEKEFFSNGPESRLERLRKFPLPEQYKIFRYGNDVIHPPLMDLARPIAERGLSAVPFLLDQLKFTTDDITVRDVLLVFELMASSKSYDVKSNKELMVTLESKVARMTDKEWQSISQKKLQRIKAAS